MRQYALITLWITVSCLVGHGQAWSQNETKPPSPPTPTQKPDDAPDKDPDRDSWPRTPETMEREVQYRAAVNWRQGELKKAQDAAEEIRRLAQRLKDPGGDDPLDPRDGLETIEKLAKRIRSYAGGDGFEARLELLPSSLRDGLAQIMELAESLKRQLEKLDYRVISVAVISESNSIIELSDVLRQRVGRESR